MIKKFDVNIYLSKLTIKTLIFIGVIFSAILLALMEIQDEYSTIRVLPYAYGLILAIFVRNENYSKFGSVALIILYFFKMCILPILLAYGEFYSQIDTSIYMPHWNEAIFYAIVEWLTVSISILIYRNFFNRSLARKLNSIESTKGINKKSENNLTIPIILITMVIFQILLIAINRDLLNYTYFIWESTTEAQYVPTYYLYKVLFEVFRIMFVLYMVYILFEKNFTFKRTISFLILGINIIIMSEFRIIGIFILIVAYLYMGYKDKNYAKYYIVSLIFITLSLVIFIFIYTSSMQTHIMISRVFNIYFGGYMIMATGLSINMENGLEIFFNDIWNGNLLFTAIWGTKYSSTDIMNANVNTAAIGTFYQLYVQSKAFFGYFAPLAVSFCIWFVFYIENKLTLDQNTFHKVLYLFIIISTSIFIIMYSFTMVVNFILFRMMFILIIIYINRRIYLRL
jgi:hypothetical protein